MGSCVAVAIWEVAYLKRRDFAFAFGRPLSTRVSVASFPAMTQESPGSVNPFLGLVKQESTNFFGPTCVVAEFVLINGFYTRILL